MSVTAIRAEIETTRRIEIVSRDYHCPDCRRFLFESSANVGTTRAYCSDCRAWKRIDHALEYPRIGIRRA